MKTLQKSLLLATLFAAPALLAVDTSVEQPSDVVDLTTPDPTKAFSLIYPNSMSWLSYNNGQYYLDYTHAFDDGTLYDRSDRCIVQAESADFGYSFDVPTVVNAYKIRLPKDDGTSVNNRAPGAWTFEGSNDKEAWTVLDARGASEREDHWGAEQDSGVSVARYYSFDNTTPYRHYRLNVSATVTTGAGYLQLAEIEFFNENPVAEEVDVEDFASHQTFRIVGMDSGVDLQKLPVLVRFDPSGMTFGRADHRDLVFTQGADDTPLPYEVDTWTATEAAVWVCVNAARYGASFTMHWGAETDCAAQCRYTWTGYASVVHFNGTASDSAKYAFTAGKSSLATDGYIGGAAAGAKTAVQRPFSRLADQTKFAASVWVRPTANNATARILSTKSAYGNSGFEFIYVLNAGLYLRGNDSKKTLIHPGANEAVFPRNTWSHYAAVVDGTSAAIYMNGLPQEADGSIDAPSFSSSSAMMLGGYNGSDDGANLSGSMDEFRLHIGVPTADRLKAEYQAMADPDFLTTESVPSSVSITGVTSSEETVDVEIEGVVTLGDDNTPVTVVIGLGTTDGVWDYTYEISNRVTGAFSYEITDVEPGLYYYSVGLAGLADSWAPSQLLGIGPLPPLEWTGTAGNSEWAAPGNWSQNRVPTAFDTVVFGDRVGASLVVTLPQDDPAEAKRIRVTTANGLTLGRSDGPALTAVPMELAAGAGRVTINADFALVSDTTITVAEGTQLDVRKVAGTRNLVVDGNGTVRLITAGGRSTGETYVLGGTLLVSEDYQLGTKLVVGGTERQAVVRTNGKYGDIRPFTRGGCPTQILANGTLDLETDGQSGTWNKDGTGPISIASGGVFKQGKRRLEYSTESVTNLFLEGTFVGATTTSVDFKDYSYFVVPETADAAPVIPTRLNVNQDVRIDVGDIPGAAVDLTLAGGIAYGWHPRDAIRKTGAGVLRLTGASTYGGGGDLSWPQGTTQLRGGTLLVDNVEGSGTGNSVIIASAGTLLGGTGRIGGLVEPISHWSGNTGSGANVKVSMMGSETAQAVLWPGTLDAVGGHVNGTLTVGVPELHHPVAFGNYSTFKASVGTTRGAYDALVVNGTVVFRRAT